MDKPEHSGWCPPAAGDPCDQWHLLAPFRKGHKCLNHLKQIDSHSNSVRQYNTDWSIQHKTNYLYFLKSTLLQECYNVNTVHSKWSLTLYIDILTDSHFVNYFRYEIWSWLTSHEDPRCETLKNSTESFSCSHWPNPSANRLLAEQF